MNVDKVFLWIVAVYWTIALIWFVYKLKKDKKNGYL